MTRFVSVLPVVVTGLPWKPLPSVLVQLRAHQPFLPFFFGHAGGRDLAVGYFLDVGGFSLGGA